VNRERAEFVRLKVDVIVASGAGGVVAKQATSVIPIVLTVAADPFLKACARTRRD
jgi:hypothetical protein